MRLFPSSYYIKSFKIKSYLSVHGNPVDAMDSSIFGIYRIVPPSVEHLLGYFSRLAVSAIHGHKKL